MIDNKNNQQKPESVPPTVPSTKIAGGTDFTAQWDRLKKSVCASGDNELGNALRKSQSAVSSAKTKKKIPTSWFVLASDLTGFSVDWLVYGEGPMYRTQDTDQAQPRRQPPAPPEAEGELDYLRRENRELREENKELRQENRVQAKEIRELVEQNAELKIEVQALKLKPDHEDITNEDVDERRIA